MNTMNRILLVDDHAKFRAVLRGYLSQDPDLRIVGEAGNIREAIDSIRVLSPHLVLTDLTMPDTRGIAAVVEIRRHYPNVKILVVSTHDGNEYKRLCCKAGASGYVVKDAIDDELRDCIRAVLGGRVYTGRDSTDGTLTNYPMDPAATGEDPAYLLH